MAPRKETKKAGQYTLAVITHNDAKEELADLRAGRGGRVSKYEPLAEAAQDLPPEQVLKVKVNKNEVGGLRGYLRRRFGETFTVMSNKVDGEGYMAFVLRTPSE